MGGKWVTVAGGRILLLDDLGRDAEGNQIVEIGEHVVLSVDEAKAVLRLAERAAGEGLGISTEADSLVHKLIESFGLEALGYQYLPWWAVPAPKVLP